MEEVPHTKRCLCDACDRTSDIVSYGRPAGCYSRGQRKRKKAAGKVPRRLFVWDNSPPVFTGHLRQDLHQRTAVASWPGNLLLKLEVARGVAARVVRRLVEARRVVA